MWFGRKTKRIIERIEWNLINISPWIFFLCFNKIQGKYWPKLIKTFLKKKKRLFCTKIYNISRKHTHVLVSLMKGNRIFHPKCTTLERGLFELKAIKTPQTLEELWPPPSLPTRISIGSLNQEENCYQRELFTSGRRVGTHSKDGWANVLSPSPVNRLPSLRSPNPYSPLLSSGKYLSLNWMPLNLISSWGSCRH